MSNIIDQTADLSGLSTVPGWDYDLPVTSGLEIFCLLGKTLPASLLNLEGFPDSPGPALVAIGSPTVSGTSGVTVDGTHQLELPVLSDASETLMFVASFAYDASRLFGVALANGSGGFGSATGVSLQSGGLHAIVNTSSGTHEIVLGSAGTDAAFAAPQFYLLKVDMTGLLVTFKNLTTPAQTGTAAITSGATRVLPGTPYLMGHLSSLDTTQEFPLTAHFLAKFNRATTTDEDAAVYARVKGSLARRGVTI